MGGTPCAVRSACRLHRGRELRQRAKKRPPCARAIREHDGNRCQYPGRLLRPDEGDR